MLRLLKYAKQYKIYAFISPILMIGEVAFELLIPRVMSDIVDMITQDGAQADINEIIKLGAKMVLYAIISLFCGSSAARLASIAGMGFGANLRNELIKKVQTFSFSNIDKFSTASLITRISTDVTSVQNTFLMMVRGLFRAPIQMVAALTIAIRMSDSVSTVFAISLPLIIVGLAVGGPIIIIRFKRMLKKFDKFNASIQENFTNIRVVKSFVRTDYEKKKFKDANDDLFNAAIQAEKIIMLGAPLFLIVMFGTILGIVLVSTKAISFGEMTVGNFTAVFTYVLQIIMSFIFTIAMLAQFLMSQASAKRIREVLNETPDIVNPENPVESVEDGSIEFDNVSFHYEEGKDNIKNLSLRIESGEMIGIMGGTGSSKSSLVQLIPRLYDVNEGKVLVGGIDVRNYDLKVLRDSVSMVLQNNVLFSGSIAENLRWGNPKATQEELEEACKIADAHEFIMERPDGYNQDLGQGGVNVSGGQKQRLCIARALLKNPKILILDDSTSAVDTATDARIREGLRKSKPDVTKIIIAQRVSSVSDCDRIIILNNGEIDDIGTHEELLERNEIYKDIYSSQQKGSDAELPEGGVD
ncbi:MAG: ABC transporter ATP-binding protein/permease [Clostridiales bacterium]|nr:ABC transporter ATP-binding protein/permease [Clostridiales bacterium]